MRKSTFWRYKVAAVCMDFLLNSATASKNPHCTGVRRVVHPPPPPPPPAFLAVCKQTDGSMEALRSHERKAELRHKSAPTWCAPRTRRRGWSRWRKPSINRSRLSTTISKQRREDRTAGMIWNRFIFFPFPPPHWSDANEEATKCPDGFRCNDSIQCNELLITQWPGVHVWLTVNTYLCASRCLTSLRRRLCLGPRSNVRLPVEWNQRIVCCCIERPGGRTCHSAAICFIVVILHIEDTMATLEGEKWLWKSDIFCFYMTSKHRNTFKPLGHIYK